MAGGAEIWRVRVRRNVVASISRIEFAEPRPAGDDPLTASTKLAGNNQRNGCLDGDYDFGSCENARHFAALCAGYLKNLCERTIEALADTPQGALPRWDNPFVPTPDGDDTGAG